MTTVNSILYALVARGNNTVLAEYSTENYGGNFITVSRVILKKIPLNDSRMSYAYNRHIFHYIVQDGFIYLCMTVETCQRRIAFGFLEDIKNRFMSAYGAQATTAMAFSMNEDFSRVLANQMQHFSNDPSVDKIGLVKQQIDDTKQVMIQNIDKLLERGEKIELLVTKTQELQERSSQFNKSSKKLKYAMWWTNIKLWILLIFIVVVIIWLASSFVCGFDYHKC